MTSNAIHAAFLEELKATLQGNRGKEGEDVLQQVVERCGVHYNAAVFAAFNDFDKDGSGKLDKAEFESVVTDFAKKAAELGTTMIDLLIENMTKQAEEDPNYPLDIVVWQFNAIRTMLTSDKYHLDMVSASQGLLSQLDADKDGLISRDEFRTGCDTIFSLQAMSKITQGMK